MKKITEQQLQAILQLLRKNNIGVNDFIAVQDMFEKLPLVEEKKVEPKK